eukprot:CAMPEP_0170509752 /NCGR_PEP_ID=MMETSP0208-20121228/65389_1 /TAXON_ID=197538 /ORGANISM="Strombidium inclinatum, Strain S3" /LENGTH=160 /DNA_ID=CAMNT_0010793145 /DNA_START=1416 /DNA_END=1898 /DNA_ORIENTATION=+
MVLEQVASYKSPFDEAMERRRMLGDMKLVENASRETLTPSGVGARHDRINRNRASQTFGTTTHHARSMSCFSPTTQQFMKRVQKLNRKDLNNSFSLVSIQNNPTINMTFDMKYAGQGFYERMRREASSTRKQSASANRRPTSHSQTRETEARFGGATTGT